MSKYKIDGKIISGNELIKIANKEFSKDSQGRGRYGRPKTHEGAYYFLSSGTNREKFKIEWYNSERKEWID